MTSTLTRSARTREATGANRTSARRPIIAAAVGLAATAAVIVGAAASPDLPGTGSVAMTHYMELLATNQPWNLLLFMAVPVVLAETVAVTELIVLFGAAPARGVRLANRWAGLIGGIYFTGVFAYLLTHAVVPLTLDGGWRGPADVIAVGSYLAGVVPLAGLALLELGILGRGATGRGRLRLHATFVGIFLVVAHVAMIFGMLDPTVLGWHTPGHAGMHM
jgi:hypothetical protein